MHTSFKPSTLLLIVMKFIALLALLAIASSAQEVAIFNTTTAADSYIPVPDYSYSTVVTIVEETHVQTTTVFVVSTQVSVVVGTTLIPTTVSGVAKTIIADVTSTQTSLVTNTLVSTINTAVTSTGTQVITATAFTNLPSTLTATSVIPSTLITTVSGTVISTVISTSLPSTSVASFVSVINGSTVTLNPTNFAIEGSGASALTPTGLISVAGLILLTIASIFLGMA
ncbi:hypothetical protein BC936DRAFT_141448 [Jimgerdemannia flammicorona]|uniref:Uncharacterized protein n=1 Tax=Jimgerdemannia flammicorona TaxID=994334 RepID=A0A433DG18_9FUNG|nr:hypothetical protein BC936DRAFT_141448 [Jimgerdemannia flammicorona]